MIKTLYKNNIYGESGILRRGIGTQTVCTRRLSISGCFELENGWSKGRAGEIRGQGRGVNQVVGYKRKEETLQVKVTIKIKASACISISLVISLVEHLIRSLSVLVVVVVGVLLASVTGRKGLGALTPLARLVAPFISYAPDVLLFDLGRFVTGNSLCWMFYHALVVVRLIEAGTCSQAVGTRVARLDSQVIVDSTVWAVLNGSSRRGERRVGGRRKSSLPCPA